MNTSTLFHSAYVRGARLKRQQIGALLGASLGLIFLAGCSRSGVIETPESLAGVNEAELAELMHEKPESLSEGTYQIGPGDVLSIYLIGRPDLLGEEDNHDGPTGEEGFVVTETPYLLFPEIGPIRVHDRTAREVEAELKKAYGRIIRNPRPVVIVKKYGRNTVEVLGMVREPGVYTWQPGDRVIDALLKAGGLNPEQRHIQQAPGRFVKIYRKVEPRQIARKTESDERYKLTASTGPSSAVPSSLERPNLVSRREITIPFREYLRTGRLRFNIPLMAGDVVYLPPAGSVIVKGSVRDPGVAYLGPSVQTLTDVISEKGGLRFSAKSKVDVIRQTTSAEPKVYSLDARDMMDRDIEDFPVIDGDQIMVYSSPPRAVVDFILSIFRGGSSAGVSATVSPTP